MSEIRIQPHKMSLCGYYCLYFGCDRCKGYSMNYIINNMTSSSEVIKFLNKHSGSCKGAECPMLQTEVRVRL